jgi:hypothetical protein
MRRTRSRVTGWRASSRPNGSSAAHRRPCAFWKCRCARKSFRDFQTVPAGSRIGWTRDGVCPLGLFDEAGCDRAADYFEVRGNELIAHRPFMPIMITADAQIAMSDCLFYIVHEVA